MKKNGRMGNTNVKDGARFEAELEAVFQMIPGCTVMKTDPPFKTTGMQGRLKVGFYQAKGLCDFEGGYYGGHVCIDAKRTGAATKRWNFKSALKDHQYQRICIAGDWNSCAGVLLQWAAAGNEGTDPAPVYWMPWGYLHTMRIKEIKSITREDLESQEAALYGVQTIKSLALMAGVHGIFKKHREVHGYA